MIAGTAVVIVVVHLVAAATGGLLDPDETAIAESARTLADARAPFVYPESPTPETALVPPAATWLASGGIFIGGASTLSARALSTLLAAFLLVASVIVLRRIRPHRSGHLLWLACVTTPLFTLNCGQVGLSAVAATSTMLAISCLTVLAGRTASTRPSRWVAVVLGVAIGIGALSAGPAGAAIHLVSIMACLVVLPDADDEKPGKVSLVVSLAIAIAGVAALVVGIFKGRSGFPSAASLGLLGCGGEFGGAATLWLGVGAVCVALVIWRAKRARRFGLHISAAVALAFAMPWTIAAFLSADGAVLCEALEHAAASPWPTHVAMAETVRALGYGLYPWMAFLPLSMLRLTSHPRDTSGLTAVVVAYIASSLGASLLGALPSQPVLVTTAVLIAVVSTIGVFSGGEKASNEVDVSERTACMIGAMLLVVVLRDLIRAPELVPSLGLSHEAALDVHIIGSTIPVIVGALTLISLLFFAARGAEPVRWIPSFISRRVRDSWTYALPSVIIVVSLFGVINLIDGMSRLSSAASWSDVFEVYDETRQRGDDLYGWREVGSGGRYYAGDDLLVLSRARELRRVLARQEGRTYFLTQTIAYRQLSEMIARITGERARPLNENRQYHIIALYDGPSLSDIERPAPVVDEVPEHARRRSEELGRSVQLVGASIAAEHAHPGDTVSVELYLRCTRELAENHQLRLHLRPRRGGWRHSEAHDPTDDLMPTTQWRPGQVIVDRSELVIPRDAEAETYTLSVELVGAGGGRRNLGEIEIE